MIRNLYEKLDRFAPKALPILHVRSIWGACFNAVAAATLYAYMNQSSSFIIVFFGFLIFCGLALPVFYYLVDTVVRFDALLIRKSRGDDSDKPQTRWRGEGNNKRK